MADEPLGARAGAGGFLTFFLLGVLVASLGPAIPTFEAGFHLTLASASLCLGALGAGALAATVGTALLTRSASAATRLTAAVIALAAGSGLIGVAPSWACVVAGAFVAGVGGGAVAASYQPLLARGFGHRSGTVLTLANGLFGLGSMIGPLLVSVLLAHGLTALYLGVAVALVATLPLVSAAPRTVSMPVARHTAPAPRATLLAFAALLFCAYGIEQMIGGWETTYLSGRGLASAIAAGAPALFWGAYTAVRLLGAPLVSRLGPALPAAALALVAVCVLASAVSPVPALLFAAAGAACALIVPSLLVWLARGVTTSDGTTIMVMAGGNVGATALPFTLGALMSLAGTAAMPLAVAAVSASSAGLCWFLTRSERERSAGLTVAAPALAGGTG